MFAIQVIVSELFGDAFVDRGSSTSLRAVLNTQKGTVRWYVVGLCFHPVL